MITIRKLFVDSRGKVVTVEINNDCSKRKSQSAVCVINASLENYLQNRGADYEVEDDALYLRGRKETPLTGLPMYTITGQEIPGTITIESMRAIAPVKLGTEYVYDIHIDGLGVRHEGISHAQLLRLLHYYKLSNGVVITASDGVQEIWSRTVAPEVQARETRRRVIARQIHQNATATDTAQVMAQNAELETTCDITKVTNTAPITLGNLVRGMSKELTSRILLPRKSVTFRNAWADNLREKNVRVIGDVVELLPCLMGGDVAHSTLMPGQVYATVDIPVTPTSTKRVPFIVSTPITVAVGTKVLYDSVYVLTERENIHKNPIYAGREWRAMHEVYGDELYDALDADVDYVCVKFALLPDIITETAVDIKVILQHVTSLAQWRMVLGFISLYMHDNKAFTAANKQIFGSYAFYNDAMRKVLRGLGIKSATGVVAGRQLLQVPPMALQSLEEYAKYDVVKLSPRSALVETVTAKQLLLVVKKITKSITMPYADFVAALDEAVKGSANRAIIHKAAEALYKIYTSKWDKLNSILPIVQRVEREYTTEVWLDTLLLNAELRDISQNGCARMLSEFVPRVAYTADEMQTGLSVACREYTPKVRMNMSMLVEGLHYIPSATQKVSDVALRGFVANCALDKYKCAVQKCWPDVKTALEMITQADVDAALAKIKCVADIPAKSGVTAQVGSYAFACGYLFDTTNRGVATKVDYAVWRKHAMTVVKSDAQPIAATQPTKPIPTAAAPNTSQSTAQRSQPQSQPTLTLKTATQAQVRAAHDQVRRGSAVREVCFNAYMYARATKMSDGTAREIDIDIPRAILRYLDPSEVKLRYFGLDGTNMTAKISAHVDVIYTSRGRPSGVVGITYTLRGSGSAVRKVQAVTNTQVMWEVGALITRENYDIRESAGELQLILTELVTTVPIPQEYRVLIEHGPTAIVEGGRKSPSIYSVLAAVGKEKPVYVLPITDAPKYGVDRLGCALAVDAYKIDPWTASVRLACNRYTDIRVDGIPHYVPAIERSSYYILKGGRLCVDKLDYATDASDTHGTVNRLAERVNALGLEIMPEVRKTQSLCNTRWLNTLLVKYKVATRCAALYNYHRYVTLLKVIDEIYRQKYAEKVYIGYMSYDAETLSRIEPYVDIRTGHLKAVPSETGEMVRYNPYIGNAPTKYAATIWFHMFNSGVVSGNALWRLYNRDFSGITPVVGAMYAKLKPDLDIIAGVAEDRHQLQELRDKIVSELNPLCAALSHLVISEVDLATGALRSGYEWECDKQTSAENTMYTLGAKYAPQEEEYQDLGAIRMSVRELN